MTSATVHERTSSRLCSNFVLSSLLLLCLSAAANRGMIVVGASDVDVNNGNGNDNDNAAGFDAIEPEANLAYGHSIDTLFQSQSEALMLRTQDDDDNEDSDPPNCTDVSKSGNRLTCWLWQLKVAIETETFRKDYMMVRIKDMVCSEFIITHINSTYTPSKTRQPHLGLALSGISATCRGKYETSGYLSGDVRASVVSDDHGVDLDMAIQSTTAGHHKDILLPSKISAANCEIDMRVPHDGLHFSGSISAHFIDLFSKRIRRYVTSALGTEVCPLISDYLDGAGQDMLTQARKWVEAHLPLTSQAVNSLIDAPHVRQPVASTTSRTHHDGYQSSNYIITPDQHVFSDLASSQMTRTNTPPADSNNDNKPGFLTPVIKGILIWTNQLIENHLNRGFLFDWIPAECDEETCGFFFRGISGTINHYTDGKIPIKLPPDVHNITLQLPYGANVTIGIYHVQWTGIDQLDKAQLFQPTDDGTMATQIESPHWEISTRVNLTVFTRPESMFYGEPLEEKFELKLTLKDIFVAFETLVEVADWDETTVLQIVDAVRNIANDNNRRQGIGCLVSLFKHVTVLPYSITKLVLDSFHIIPRNTANDSGNDSHDDDDNGDDAISNLELDLDNLLNTVVQMLTTEYSEALAGVIQRLTGVEGVERLNAYLQRVIDEWGTDPDTNEIATCPKSELTDHPRFLNFTDVKLLGTINHFLNNRQTLNSFNDYLNCLSRIVINHRHLSDEEGTSKEAADQSRTSLASGDIDWGGLGSLVKIREISLRNFDTLDHLEVLLPSRDTPAINLLHSLAVYAKESESSPMVYVSLDIEIPEFDLAISFNSSLLLGDVVVQLGSRIDYDLNQLANKTISNIMHYAQCAAVPLSELKLVQPSSLSVGQFESNVSISIVQGAHEPVNFDVGTKKYPVIAEVLSAVMDWSWHTTYDVVNKAAEKLVVQAPHICHGDLNPDSVVPAPARHDDHAAFMWFVAAFFGLGQIIFFAVQRTRKLNQLRRTNSENDGMEEQLLANRFRVVGETLEPCLSSPLDEDIMAEINEDINERILEDQGIVESQPHSLFKAEEVPAIIRHTVPIVIACTIVMLLSGNLSVGASVDINIQLGDDQNIFLPQMFGFSLGHTIRQLYAAGIYPLLFLVVGFSGMWPYGKLLLMLRAWTVPTLNRARRERVLLMLDALGKFSLVDTYVLVLFMVAFRYHLELSDSVVLDVFVAPHRGFYGFLLATSISLLLGHLMLFYHRKCQNEGQEVVSTSVESVLGHTYKGGPDDRRHKISILFKALLFIASVAALVLMCIGFTKESFIFEFGGVAGAALGDRRRSAYSLLSIGAFLSDNAENPHGLGVFAIQAAFFFYAVITPVACLVLLNALMLYPMDLKRQRKTLVLAEIANAWSAVEVFALSIIAALLQISTFADFMIGDKCDVINAILGEFSSDDPVCYSVSAAVAPDCWYLVVGVLLNSALVSCILRLAQCAVHDREKRCMRREASHDDAIQERNKSIVDGIYRFPILRWLFLKPAVVADAGSVNEDRRSGEEWRYWF